MRPRWGPRWVLAAVVGGAAGPGPPADGADATWVACTGGVSARCVGTAGTAVRPLAAVGTIVAACVGTAVETRVGALVATCGATRVASVAAAAWIAVARVRTVG